MLDKSIAGPKIGSALKYKRSISVVVDTKNHSEQLPQEIDQVLAFASATKLGKLIEHRQI